VVYSSFDSKNVPFEEKLDNLFNQKEGGIYVELGANDGLLQSNTAFLEKERNWTGVLVEPSKSNFSKCKKNRPGSKVYNYACVSSDFKDKYIDGDWENGLMSSVNSKRALLHPLSPASASNIIKVEAATLESILDKAELTDIDLLTLDTEGYELEVLKGLNLEKYKPSYMLIEVYKDDYQNIESFLSQYNYILFENFSNYNKKDNPQWDETHQDILFKKNK
tara:strand:- start:353 stop:1015 length:663 start_codon:yes stop_codon:yes gene_type:complete